MNLASPPADLLNSVLDRNDKLHGGGSAIVADLPSDTLSDALIMERIIDSCSSVFTKMCKIDVARCDVQDISSMQSLELSGVIAIAGARSVMLAVKLSEQLAFAVAQNLIGAQPTAIDADVIDLVGELANMIAGSAKERLNHQSLMLGLPTVITGKGHQVMFAKGMRTSTINFDCDAGTLQLEIGMLPLKK
jgi:chemotaxis protein CheX